MGKEGEVKITKYPQSCLLIEKEGGRLLIDPGNFAAETYSAEEFLPLDGVLVTHLHPDHADRALLGAFGAAGVRIVANAATAEAFLDINIEVVEDGSDIEIADFHVKAHELPHCLMVDGSKGPQNTGFIIDETFFHPGDGVDTTGVTVGAAAVPISGPDVSPHDAYSFLRSHGFKTAIPVHYDYFIADPDFFKKVVASFTSDVTVVPLRDGESTDV